MKLPRRTATTDEQRLAGREMDPEVAAGSALDSSNAQAGPLDRPHRVSLCAPAAAHAHGGALSSMSFS